MDKLYKKLYEEYIEKAGKTPIDKAAIFVPMRGKQYHPTNKIRLMIVGRAPNGWNSKIDYSTGEVFGNSAKELYEDRKRFTWIKEAECLYHYFLSGSAFWRVTKKIWTTLSKIDDEEWYEYIAWTNLYKISNQEGNPSGNMYYAQIDSCREILEKEIRDYDPTHIVFITDYKIWIQDSYNKGKCSFEGIVKATINNDKKFGECIEAYGCGIAGTKAKFVVTCRPEGHKEDVFIKEVCECFETI